MDEHDIFYANRLVRMPIRPGGAMTPQSLLLHRVTGILAKLARLSLIARYYGCYDR
jgi:hypothetical protein